MKPIKTIAGEILLYLYYIQRKCFSELNDAMIRFEFGSFNNKETNFSQRELSILNLDKFSSYSDNDILNAVNYLNDSGLIYFKESKDNIGTILFNFKLTDLGIDLIEGIERGDDEKKNFNVTFNFNINNDVTIESLIKTEFGSLIKNSLL